MQESDSGFLELFGTGKSLLCAEDPFCSLCVLFLWERTQQSRSLVKYVGMTSAAWISPGQHIAEHSAPRLSGITAGMERGSVRNRESIPAYPLLYRKRRVLCLLSSIDPVWKTGNVTLGRALQQFQGSLFSISGWFHSVHIKRCLL